MITVQTMRAKITTERKLWNPATRQHHIQQGKMTLLGVKIAVETPYGTSYEWKCYIRKGQPCSWKRESVNSATRRDYYTEDEVLQNLVAQAGLDGIDKMIEAKAMLAELCAA